MWFFALTKKSCCSGSESLGSFARLPRVRAIRNTEQANIPYGISRGFTLRWLLFPCFTHQIKNSLETNSAPIARITNLAQLNGLMRDIGQFEARLCQIEARLCHKRHCTSDDANVELLVAITSPSPSFTLKTLAPNWDTLQRFCPPLWVGFFISQQLSLTLWLVKML